MDNMTNYEMMDILHITQVLATMQVGFWTIELPNHGAPKMYGDATILIVLGVETDALTPEALYEHWMKHIDSKYLGIVMQTVEALKQGKTVRGKIFMAAPPKGMALGSMRRIS